MRTKKNTPHSKNILLKNTMLDIKFIRENPGVVKTAMKNRGVDFDVGAFLAVDEKRRVMIKETDDLRARQNEFADEIGKLGGEERQRKIEESKKIKMQLASADEELKALEEQFTRLMHQIPNIPLPDVPVGRDERDNVVLREVGEKPQFDFTPCDYMEIAGKFNLIDTNRAAKVSGSRFGYIMGDLARLEFALVQFAFDTLTKEGFIAVVPPVLIKEDMMQKLGYIDSEKDKAERYYLSEDKMYLVGTAEQSVVPMHADEILEEKDLPRRYVAFSTCFRREAGTYGKDTHGILRVHQFDKMEMVIFSRPEDSASEHELLIAMEEHLMQGLKIPYRVMALCTGDIAAPSARTVDIESWLPGQNSGKGEYRETHSSSNTTDFQARRLNIKVRRNDGKNEYVNILNGTAFAIGRTLIAILENYQQEDGSVRLPEVLQKYMGGLKVIQRS